MALSSNIRAGAAYVELYAKDNKLIRGLNRAAKRLKAFGATISTIGKRMMTVGAVLAAPFALATRTYANFSDTMSAVKAITGATGKEFERLNEQAKELGRTTSFTASQVAGAQVELGRMGFKTREIEDAIPGILNLARATGTELPNAAAIAAASLRGFQMEASETARVADVLTATANNSSQTLEDIGEAMKYVAPIAKEAGASIEDTAAALGILANNGIKGTMAGNAVARAYKNIAAGKGAGIFKKLAIDTADAAGNLRPLSDILSELGEKTKGMGSAERLAGFETLFGRAQAAALKLAGGTAEFENLRKVLQESAGTAKKTAKVMDDNLGGGFRRLWSAVEGVQIAIGEALDGALRDMSKRLARAAAWVTKLVRENRGLVVALVKVVAGLIVAGVALVLLGTLISGLGSVLGAFAAVITGVGTAIGILGTVLAALLSPIGLVITAVVALGAYILYATGAAAKALSWLAEKFGKLADDAKAAWKGIGDALATGDIALAAKILWLTLVMEWKRGVKALKSIWLTLKRFTLTVWHGIESEATIAVHGIRIAFIEGVAGMEKAWASLTAFMHQSFETATDWIAKRMLEIRGAFDESFDVETAKKMIDIQAKVTTTRIESKMKGQKKEAEDIRKKMREKELAGHEKALAAVGKSTLAVENEYAEKMTEAETDLAAARKEWRDALAEAKGKRAGAAEGGPGRMEKPEALLEKVKAAVAGLGDQLEKTAEKTIVRGTFSAAAIASIMGGIAPGVGIAERTARAAEETAKNTRPLRDLDDDNALALG